MNDFFSGKKLEFLNKPVKVADKIIAFDNRNERFWHIITDPHVPDYTNIKEKRAERLCWIRPIIENHNNDEFLVYKRIKKNETYFHLFIPSCEYMIILIGRKKSFYLITAFHIDYSYKINEYLREYEKYKDCW